MFTAITSLSLTAFRSYRHARISTDGARMVVLSGPNGAGKTNILEAISLLTSGRGLKRASLGELQSLHTPQPWAVAATIATAQGETNIGTGQDPQDSDNQRRIVLLDGRKTTPAKLGGQLAISWLTPAMERLWNDAPSSRRRFLDHLTQSFEPDHSAHLSRYEDATAQRNRLLKEGKNDDRWLAGLEQIMAQEGVIIASQRRTLVRSLNEQIRTSPRVSDFPLPHLTLTGIENWLDEGSALQAEDRLRAALMNGRTDDALKGSTQNGPHRSDLVATHPLKQMPAHLCSTGEQKALLTGLVLSHAWLVRDKRRMAPLLLLDEVAAHFDETRRDCLFAEALALGGQVWLTGAESALFSSLQDKAQCLHLTLSDSQVQRAENTAKNSDFFMPQMA